jgi:hypothetical protein
MAPLIEDVRALQALDLAKLRAEWRARYGPPPRLRSERLLRHILAWRMQTQSEGGLDRRTARILGAATPPSVTKPKVQEGVRLVREWKGRTYHVEVTDGAYVLEGVRYASLSQVARSITGVRWNGPRFFGLRKTST